MYDFLQESSRTRNHKSPSSAQQQFKSQTREDINVLFLPWTESTIFDRLKQVTTEAECDKPIG